MRDGRPRPGCRSQKERRWRNVTIDLCKRNGSKSSEEQPGRQGGRDVCPSRECPGDGGGKGRVTLAHEEDDRLFPRQKGSRRPRPARDRRGGRSSDSEPCARFVHEALKTRARPRPGGGSGAGLPVCSSHAPRITVCPSKAILKALFFTFELHSRGGGSCVLAERFSCFP